MRTMVQIFAVAAVLVAIPSSCFALWGIAEVTPESAKKLGMQVRSQAAGPVRVRVELEFKAENELKDFSRVDLRVGEGVTAPLKEDRSQPGKVIVSFDADRDQLGQIQMWVFVPESRGGVIYAVRVKDFVPAEKAP